ncbi:MAG: imidazolonepropionase [Firmicutes bacterium]|nr:imidazolonepropionase [Bacillota bacterium]
MIDLLIHDAAEVVTLSAAAVAEEAGAAASALPRRGPGQGALGRVRQGFVAVRGGRILGAGPMRSLPREWRRAREEVDARGRAVLPGFVDPHTHVVYAGDRMEEYVLRVGGASYEELARRGGGILATVEATRRASADELAEAARPRLGRMLAAGTTTAEVKSGYGLRLEDERKILETVRRLGREQPVELVPTFLGAHELPPEWRGRPGGEEAYAAEVAGPMLEAVVREGLARSVDVFLERGVFGRASARRVLEAGRAAGLLLRLHADQLSGEMGGAELAAELRVRAADHLEHASRAGLEAMAAAGVAAVLLPGATLLLGSPPAPARAMVELGVPVALGTDSNPGSSPLESQAVAMGLACALLRLTPAEALVAATLNAAWVLGLEGRLGSLEPGKQADLLLLEEPTYLAVPYRLGSNLVRAVWKAGRRVA